MKPSEKISQLYADSCHEHQGELSGAVREMIHRQSIIRYLDEQYELKEAILKEMNNALNAHPAQGEKRDEPYSGSRGQASEATI